MTGSTSEQYNKVNYFNMKKETSTKKKVAKKVTRQEKVNPAHLPYIPEMKCLMREEEVDYKTRTVLLLDARNDLVPMFFAGLDSMAANYKSKAVNFYVDFVYKTCKGFIEVCGERSVEHMYKRDQNPTFGIGDIVKNTKQKRRFIINLYLDEKDGLLYYTYVDPDNAKAPRGACTEKTMMSWAEKY